MSVIAALAAEADRASHLHSEYRRLLALVASIQAGKVDPRLVQIDWMAESWEVVTLIPGVPLPDPIQERIKADRETARTRRELGEKQRAEAAAKANGQKPV